MCAQHLMHTVHTSLSYTCILSIQTADKGVEQMIKFILLTDLRERERERERISPSYSKGSNQQILYSYTIQTFLFPLIFKALHGPAGTITSKFKMHACITAWRCVRVSARMCMHIYVSVCLCDL